MIEPIFENEFEETSYEVLLLANNCNDCSAAMAERCKPVSDKDYLREFL